MCVILPVYLYLVFSLTNKSLSRIINTCVNLFTLFILVKVFVVHIKDEYLLYHVRKNNNTDMISIRKEFEDELFSKFNLVNIFLPFYVSGLTYPLQLLGLGLRSLR